MQVREATPADADEIVRLKAEIMTSAYPYDVELDAHPEWPERARAAVVQMIKHPDYAFFVIDGDDGRLVGSISASISHHVPGTNWGPTHAYLGDMCTDAHVRGQGLGRRLMDRALDWCRERGASSVKLDATPSAVAIYERFGFERRTGPELFPTMWLRL